MPPRGKRDRRGCGRGRRAGARRPRARARCRCRAPRREAGERVARRRRGRRLGAHPRLRPGPFRGRRDADSGRRRAGHARVHRTGAATRRARRGRRRRLVGRCAAVRGARGTSSLLALVPRRDGRGDYARAAAASHRAAGPARRAALGGRPITRPRSGEAAVGGEARAPAAPCARRPRRHGARERPASRAAGARSGARRASTRASARRCFRSTRRTRRRCSPCWRPR